MAQQASIAAGDHGEAAAYELHRRKPARRCFPRFVGKIASAEQGAGDFAMASAAEATIDCLQHAAGTVTLLPREPRVGRDESTMKGTQEARDRFEAVEPLEAERNDGRRALGGAHAGKAQNLKPLSVLERVNEMTALLIR